jgi:hypothetical protein
MSIAAMKQALHVLESVDGTPVCNETDYLDLSEDIAALRAAIAEASMQRLTDVQQEMDCYGDGNVYRGQRSADSQIRTISVQEPAIYPDEARELGLEEIAYYTHPPRREWVGLTEVDPSVEQLDQIIGLLARTHVRISARKLLRVWIVAYTRAIEAKLKDKNHG